MLESAQPAREWSDPMLSAMRKCDPIADGLIHHFFESHTPTVVHPHELLQDILNYRVQSRDTQRLHATNPQSVTAAPSGAEQLVVQLLEADPPVLPDHDLQQRVARFFIDYGPELMSMLGYYSLPVAYGAANRVQVLAATRYMEKRNAPGHRGVPACHQRAQARRHVACARSECSRAGHTAPGKASSQQRKCD